MWCGYSAIKTRVSYTITPMLNLKTYYPMTFKNVHNIGVQNWRIPSKLANTRAGLNVYDKFRVFNDNFTPYFFLYFSLSSSPFFLTLQPAAISLTNSIVFSSFWLFIFLISPLPVEAPTYQEQQATTVREMRQPATV